MKRLKLKLLLEKVVARKLDRLVDQFPEGEQAQVRTQLSTSLLAVACQQLVRLSTGKGRVAAFELMLSTPAIQNMIRSNHPEKIASEIQTGRRLGMQLLDDHLFELVTAGQVTAEDALAKANDRAQLAARLSK